MYKKLTVFFHWHQCKLKCHMRKSPELFWS